MAFTTSRVCGVLVTGPLAPFADLYRLSLERRRYSPWTTVGQLRLLARLSRWLDAMELAAAELTVGRVDEFLEYQRAGGRDRSGWSRPGVVCLLEVLRGQGVLDAEQPRALSSDERLLESFEAYLLVERGLAAGTVHGYVGHARRFLGELSKPLGLLTASEVTAAVLGRSASVSVSATQFFIAGLKSFLRFCFVEGLVEVDLSGAALAMTGRRGSSLPRGISNADSKALLDSCDRRSALGRRDFALIITLLRLGLRRAEVAALSLDDIDWRAGELVVHGKGARQDRLPLPAEVGDAIAAYLRRGRPASERREVFLRAKAPFEPIAPGTVASTVRRACRRAGIAEVGPHQLRHTLACQMVGAEVPLVEIAQVLRHRSLQSTAIYARVDLEQLRLLCLPWPGGSL